MFKRGFTVRTVTGKIKVEFTQTGATLLTGQVGAIFTHPHSPDEK